MTKLEYLLQLPPNRVRDTWIVYGGIVVGPNQTEFAKDSIIQLAGTGTVWDDALFFITEDLHLTPTTLIDWNNVFFDIEAKGTLRDEHGIIFPHLFCVCSATKFHNIIEPIDYSFVAFSALAPVDISDTDLERILLEVGVPFIRLEELEYTRDQILSLVVQPAIEEYYRYFPIREVHQEIINNNTINIPMPPYIQFFIRAYVIPGYSAKTDFIKNPLLRYFDEVILATSTRGAFTSPLINSAQRQGYVDTTGFTTYVLEKALRQGALNYGTKQYLHLDVKNRTLVGYSTIRGIVEVEWGSVSYKWTDIPLNRQREVRELATARLLRALYSLRNQVNNNSIGNLNVEHFNTRANDLETKILEKWSSEVEPTFIRN